MSTRTTAKAQDAGPLVVCCARAEADEIRTALAEMEELGHTLEIVAGVEADPRLLTPVIERLHGDGLYVLCRSKLLGRDTVEQLREILLTHHVPFGRTVTVATRRPRDLVDRIKASVTRSGTRRSGKGEGETAAAPVESSATARAAVEAAATKLPGRATGPAGVRRPTLVATPAALALSRAAQARTTSPRDVAFEEAITGAQKVLPRDASPPEPTADDAGEGIEDFDPPTVELPAMKERALSEPTDPELSAISLTDAAIEMFEEEEDFEPEDIDPLHDPRHDIESSLAGVNLSSVDFSDLERAESGRIALQGLSVPVRTGNTSVAPAPAPPRPEPSIPGPPTPAPPTPSPAPPRAAVTAPPPGYTARPTTLAVPAVPSLSALGTASAPTSAPASMGPQLDVDDSEGGPRNKLLWGIGLGAVAVVALVIAVAMGGGDDAPEGSVASSDPAPAKAADETAAKSSEPQATAPGGEGEPTGTDAPPPAADPEDEALAAVTSALSERKVRALDILLVQPASVGPMTHGDARAYCDALDLAGLSGWRLPEVGELYSLSEAGMVGASVYWSHTAGDTFGDSHLAWHGRRKRVQHESGTSRVLCVHGDRAAL